MGLGIILVTGTARDTMLPDITGGLTVIAIIAAPIGTIVIGDITAGIGIELSRSTGL